VHTSPALLVSYVYLREFRKIRPDIAFRDWSMDSGAFSVKAGTGAVRIEEYTELCRELLATDPQLTEVFALDVIGDWHATARNTEWMWERGVPAIPCFHAGEPEEALLAMAARYPKVALGGMVGYVGPKKVQWIQQCFTRIWPKKIHGFGIAGRAAMLAVPWHSTDATNWELGPTRFGNWRRYGGLSVRGSTQQLRHEVEHYLRLEALAQHKFAAQMQELGGEELSLRLSVGGPINALRNGLKAVGT
jgi:hypothetical protein